MRCEFHAQQRVAVGMRPSPAHRTAILTAIALACLGVSTACGPSRSAKQTDAKESDAKVTAEAQLTTVKRYSLTGRVVSIDKANQSINVDGDAIPGFMAAMTMPYPVKDASILEKVSPGDQIKAEIVVGNEGAHLENVVATKTLSQTTHEVNAPPRVNPSTVQSRRK